MVSFRQTKKEKKAMIYTITTNPSLDYSMYLMRFAEGAVNRSVREDITFGGKGINVSVVLARLGMESTALGFVAGFVGDEIERLVRNEGVMCDFVHTEGLSRINIKLYAEEESAVNGAGPQVSERAEACLLKKLAHVTKDDFVVISGASASSESGNLTENVLKAAQGAKIVADMEGKALETALNYRPFLIKPNLEELSGLFPDCGMTEENVVDCALRLRGRGAENVLVSLGAGGAILAASDGRIYRKEAPQGEVKSTVGAGDSMVAGFISSIEHGFAHALENAVAAGSATAFSEGLASRSLLLEHIKR